MVFEKTIRMTVLCAVVAASLPGQIKPATVPPAPAAKSLTTAEAREAQLAADTEKLYQLAQELKVELDKTTKDTLSLTVVKKAAEIEKLAHSISERMKAR